MSIGVSNATSVHCSANCRDRKEGSKTYCYTREIETDFLFGVFPENYFIETNFKSFHFPSLKVVNMIVALSVFIVNETEFRPAAAPFVGWLPRTNADAPL